MGNATKTFHFAIGLVPKYVAKKTYGKVPPYIVKKNVEMDESKERYANYVKNLFGARAAPVLPEVRNARGKDVKTKGQLPSPLLANSIWHELATENHYKPPLSLLDEICIPT